MEQRSLVRMIGQVCKLDLPDLPGCRNLSILTRVGPAWKIGCVTHYFLVNQLHTSPVPLGQHTLSTTTPSRSKNPSSTAMCSGEEKCSGTVDKESKQRRGGGESGLEMTMYRRK